MTFTKQLYERICDALPGTTSRSFSRLCGRSDGYFGSINAQQLAISTNSLIYLAEMLEHFMSVRRHLQPSAVSKLRQAQEFIANEIARRTQEFEIDNLPVRQMIISAVASAAYARDQQCFMPTVIFG